MAATVNASDLIAEVATLTEQLRPRAKLIIEGMAAVIAEHLAQGERIRIPNLGTLSLRPTPPRSGTFTDRNGAKHAWTKPAGKRLAIKPHAKLASAVGITDPDGDHDTTETADV